MVKIQLLPSGELWFRDFLFYTLPLVLILFFWIRRRYQYWSRKGVSGPIPIFPLGHYVQRLWYCPKALELSWAKKYGKMYGLYTGLKPILTITDPELVKQIFVRDFHHFINRRDSGIHHDIWSNSMFFVRDDSWKRIRSISSPAFTTGKLRRMYPLIHIAVEQMMDVLNAEHNKSEDIDIKSVTVGYTMAGIASSMFNINPETNGDPSKYNEFRHHGRNILSSPHRFILTLIAPRWLLHAIGVDHPLEPKAFSFLSEACRKIIQNKTDKDCLVSLLNQVSISEEELKNMKYDKLTADQNIDSFEDKYSNKTDKFLTENEIIAQMVTFFFAGFESMASTISNTIFELANNKDAQTILQQELDECFEKTKDYDLIEKYEALNKLPYLDAVLKEGMRKNPVVIRLERQLTSEHYEVDGVELDKGVIVELPTQALHLNEEYWPEPEAYRPERFLPENKDKIVPYTYFPFGEGPRNCIGMRFAMLQCRVALAYIAHKYSFDVTNGTPKKFQYHRGTPILQAVPYPIKFLKRT